MHFNQACMMFSVLHFKLILWRCSLYSFSIPYFGEAIRWNLMLNDPEPNYLTTAVFIGSTGRCNGAKTAETHVYIISLAVTVCFNCNRREIHSGVLKPIWGVIDYSLGTKDPIWNERPVTATTQPNQGSQKASLNCAYSVGFWDAPKKYAQRNFIKVHHVSRSWNVWVVGK